MGPASMTYESRLGSRTIGRSATKCSRMGMNHDSSRGSFIPMNDLLKRNHHDRVQDYLSQMDYVTED